VGWISSLVAAALVENERDADGPGFVDEQHCRPAFLLLARRASFDPD
jgi:hypothetical protein